MPRPRPSITTARRRRGSSRVAAMTSALAGTRVVEQGTFITGPCAAMMLADLGADVIKIESPDGDPYRSYQGQQYSPHFQAYNRNRRSLALDMKDAKDCELFSGLVREADVYIQNFRPGTADRLGAPVGRGGPGRGCHVEVSMREARAHFAVEPCAAFSAPPQTPTSADRPRLAQAYILRTADERLIAIHLSSLEKFWQGLVQALEAPELARDPRFATRAGRIEEYEALRIELDAHFSRRTLDEWMHRLEAHDVPHAPVNRIDEVVHDPQVEHLGVIVPVEAPHGAARAVRPAVRFDGVRAEAVSAAPLLDEHGRGGAPGACAR